MAKWDTNLLYQDNVAQDVSLLFIMWLFEQKTTSSTCQVTFFFDELDNLPMYINLGPAGINENSLFRKSTFDFFPLSITGD